MQTIVGRWRGEPVTFYVDDPKADTAALQTALMECLGTCPDSRVLSIYLDRALHGPFGLKAVGTEGSGPGLHYRLEAADA